MGMHVACRLSLLRHELLLQSRNLRLQGGVGSLHSRALLVPLALLLTEALDLEVGLEGMLRIVMRCLRDLGMHVLKEA